MKRMSDEQKALALRMHLAAQREGKRQGRGLVCSPLESTQFFSKQRGCQPNKLIQGGFCVDRVSSANPAPQTCFKESCYLRRAFDAGIDRAAVCEKERDAVQVQYSVLAQIEQIIAKTCTPITPRCASVMTAAQPFSSSEMDVIKGKKQGESKSDHLPRGQVTAYYVYHSRRGPAEAGGEKTQSLDREERLTSR